MGSFKCRCGYTMLLKSGVEPYEQYITQSRVVDVELYDLAEALISDIQNMKGLARDMRMDAFVSAVKSGMESVLRCPNCDRIWTGTNRNEVLMAHVREIDTENIA
jgi:2,3-bisphosphoglycerate-independent phosphoglycerate mutase